MQVVAASACASFHIGGVALGAYMVCPSGWFGPAVLTTRGSSFGWCGWVVCARWTAMAPPP